MIDDVLSSEPLPDTPVSSDVLIDIPVSSEPASENPEQEDTSTDIPVSTYETTTGPGSTMEILTIPFEEYTLDQFFLFGIFCVLIVHVFFSLFNHK